jgi:hypothetical protein
MVLSKICKFIQKEIRKNTQLSQFKKTRKLNKIKINKAHDDKSMSLILSCSAIMASAITLHLRLLARTLLCCAATSATTMLVS